LELVGARFCHRVDRAAGESALANVVGRDRDLDLGDHVLLDRLGVRLSGGGATRLAETEQVVVVRAVDLDVVVLAAAAGEADVLLLSSSSPPSVGRMFGRGQDASICSVFNYRAGAVRVDQLFGGA
jgi:hypothetical protein